MPNPKILFASILKPVDDIRSFHKLGMSLKEEEVDLHFFGYPSKQKLNNSLQITFHQLHKFKRLSVYRLITPWIFFFKILKVKPHIIVVNSIDLLNIIYLIRIILGTKIIYDIQENHALNIRNQAVYPSLFKKVLSTIVRMSESFNARFIDHFILAEDCYKHQLPFLGDNYTILQNKHLKKDRKPKRIKNTEKTTFLFSGTVSEEFGVLEAISIFTKLHVKDPNSTLHIIGKAKDDKSIKRLKKLQKTNPAISLTVSTTPIPHEEIEKAISEADFGILSYQNNPAFDKKIPTKVFEYLSNKLPMLVFDDLSFASLITENNAGIAIPRTLITSDNLLTTQLKATFYKRKLNINPHWEAEKVAFIELIKRLTP